VELTFKSNLPKLNEAGKNIACTVVEVGPCVITQVKTTDTDGYNALQIGFGDAKAKNTSKAMIKIFKRKRFPRGCKEIQL